MRNIFFFAPDNQEVVNVKLEEKWKGPYTINAILLNGSYKIADQYGVLRTPVNGDRLKRYDR